MKGTLICILSLWAAFAAADQIVWDQGPGTGTITQENLNVFLSLNDVDSVALAQATVVDTYYEYGQNPAEQDFAVAFYADAGGVPGTQLAVMPRISTGSRLVGMDLSGLPVYEHKITFSDQPFTLQANTTYWIGASVTGTAGSCALISAPQDGRCAAMQNGQYFGNNPNGDLMFRLASPVPEPASWAVMMLGVMALAKRRRCQ